jgi:soluble lytic murein transglycosylase
MALHAARRHDPLTLDWYGYAEGTPLNRDQIAWKARAALRVKQWETVQETIDAMPRDMREEQAWQYWYGRALKEKGLIVAANKILLPLSRERTYYGLLAEEELGEIIGAPPESYKATQEDIRAAQSIPGIQRALELQRLDMRWESRSEWARVVKILDDRQLIAAAEVAFREEWYDIAINTAEKTRLTHDFAMRYPTPYREVMQNYVRENGLDEAWVYGLIRQESRFISYARSGVGARGLMQVMPATAKWIAKRMGMDGYNHGMINELDTNIQFGTHYLRYALDKMGGQTLMATAAYNAGPSRALRWAPADPMEGAIYAETIPFSETRNYVQKVMSNAYFYAHRLGGQVQTVKQRLGLIAGRTTATTAVAPEASQAEE